MLWWLAKFIGKGTCVLIFMLIILVIALVADMEGFSHLSDRTAWRDGWLWMIGKRSQLW